MTELSLAFIKQQVFVTRTIIGAPTVAQLKEKFYTINVSVSYEIIAEISKVYAIILDPAL